mgnify:CR=1 FL=1
MLGSAEAPADTKPARYRLSAFITHLGKSTGTGSATLAVTAFQSMIAFLNAGHYVAHILKEGKWVLFNDFKVRFLARCLLLTFLLLVAGISVSEAELGASLHLLLPTILSRIRAIVF